MPAQWPPMNRTHTSRGDADLSIGARPYPPPKLRGLCPGDWRRMTAAWPRHGHEWPSVRPRTRSAATPPPTRGQHPATSGVNFSVWPQAVQTKATGWPAVGRSRGRWPGLRPAVPPPRERDTRPRRHRAGFRWDHPARAGSTRCTRRAIAPPVGSPPARAGNTGALHDPHVGDGDHPRASGEHVAFAAATWKAPGSPPREQGALLQLKVRAPRMGITPARAGSTNWGPHA